MHSLDREKLPAHVAIIMDGNGRWAKLRNRPRIEGHIAGIESVREIVTMTRELRIPYLTLYAFSKENWVRPKDEVERLLELLGVYLDKELPLMLEKGICFNVIGEKRDFPEILQDKLAEVMKKTARNRGLVLNLALSYSGRREILNAVTTLIEDVKKGLVKSIDEEVFRKHLYTGAMPDPDLLIRTSGEMRLSNFLLWQMAYTEIYVTDTFWPDFKGDQYAAALREFGRRERRFGRVKEN
ncbi:isoprenyl transferase [Syntrophorhabdus aromaticivorans]|uniref:Isoprenyl transferase n=1 Tax=Syntrophorhabdus aromaticivorans TaxID=328301 RepID=A0A351U2N4_9BACT|nr:isoprenyl transferase [Syntrophorhabdus aromaticivorans]NLW36594.1 isoprenyl transferase [Syntrophorhabdus aromaticivorans]HBA54215.1 isoprenyl transferase [Syntrophorhabdus aromaticivorans]